MSDVPDRLMRLLGEQATARLAQLGYSNAMTSEAKREAEWWLRARIGALTRRKPLLSGWGVMWRNPASAELVPIEVPAAGAGEVTIQVVASSISPGTERAQYLRLPNAPIFYPHRPGYSAVGIVVAVGAGVSGLELGDRVAASGVAHVSVATVPRELVFKLDAGVSAEDAALIHLGIIARQGVRRAELVPGEPACVVGAGLVGALAQRLAAAEGAGAMTVVARSRHKEQVARAGGAAEFLVAGEDDERIAELASPVVLEATGDPQAVPAAVTAAGPGGRVVLLGSPRGTTGDLPVEAIRERRLRVIGAHVNTLEVESASTGLDMRRQEAEAFLAALADGRLQVGDLTATVVDPREAGAFYRRLARDRDLVGARFDWTRLPDGERAGQGRLLRLPDLSGRGVESERDPLPANGRGRRRRRGSTPELADPFAGASGHLRFGLLGCGDIATENAAGLAGAPNTELVACFDPVASLAAEVAAAHGAETAESAEALFERGDVDAVLLSVPHHLHAPLTIAAAERGCHVVVEKPMANNLEAAQEMASAAQRAGVVLSVCFPHRYRPDVVAARRLIEEGGLGSFGGALLAVCDDKPASYWHGGFSGRAQSDWRASREKAGGGTLIMNLSHYIDLLRHLVGVDPELVTAVAAAVDEPAEVEDTTSVTATYANGAVASLFGCSAVRGARSAEMRLWGHEGHIVLDEEPRVYTLRATDSLRTTRWQTFGPPDGVSIRAAYLSRFASAVSEGREPEVSAADGLAVQAVMEAAYRSSELGIRVRPAELLEAMPAPEGAAT